MTLALLTARSARAVREITIRHLLVLASCALCVAGAGCSASPSTLTVDVVTELVPARELASLEVALVARSAATATSPAREDVLRVIDVEVRGDQDFARGLRVASFSNLEPGVHLVRVRARRPDGRWLVVTRAAVLVRDTSVVRVRLSRSCIDVMCPADASSDRSACADGMCVEPRCVADPSACPDEPASCTSDASCTREGLPACARLICDGGECVAAGDDGACDAEDRCDVVLGCVDRGTLDAGPLDAEVPDAGVPDATGGVDAGLDDGGPLATTDAAMSGSLCAVPGEPCVVGVTRLVGGVVTCVRLGALADETPCGPSGEVCLGGACRVPVPFADFPARWAEAACDALELCLGPDHVWLGTRAHCEAEVRHNLGESEIGRVYLAGAGEAPYDALAAARCLGAVSASCGAFVAALDDRLPECDEILRCDRGATADCQRSDRECSAGLACFFDDSYSPLVRFCEAPRGERASCTVGGGVRWCGRGLECRNAGLPFVDGRCMRSASWCGDEPPCSTPLETCSTTTLRRCVPSASVGAPLATSCRSVTECVAGLTCIGGMCATPLPTGAPCTDTGTEDDCLEGACVAGVCASGQGLGAPCGSDSTRWLSGQTRSACRSELHCDGGTCRERALPGEACSATRRCGNGQSCTSGVCVTSGGFSGC